MAQKEDVFYSYHLVKKLLVFLPWKDRICLSGVNVTIRGLILGSPHLSELLKVPQPATALNDIQWNTEGDARAFEIFTGKIPRSSVFSGTVPPSMDCGMKLCSEFMGQDNCSLNISLPEGLSNHNIRGKGILVKDGRGMICRDLYPLPITRVELVQAVVKQWTRFVYNATESISYEIRQGKKPSSDISDNRKLWRSGLKYPIQEDVVLHAVRIEYLWHNQILGEPIQLTQYVLMFHGNPSTSKQPVITSSKSELGIGWCYFHDIRRLLNVPYIESRVWSRIPKFLDETGLVVHPPISIPSDATKWTGPPEHEIADLPVLQNWSPKINTFWQKKLLEPLWWNICRIYDRLVVYKPGRLDLLPMHLWHVGSKTWRKGHCLSIDNVVHHVLTGEVNAEKLAHANWLQIHDWVTYTVEPGWVCEKIPPISLRNKVRLWIHYRRGHVAEELSDRDFFDCNIMPQCKGLIVVFRKNPPAMICVETEASGSGFFECGDKIGETWINIVKLERAEVIKVTAAGISFNDEAASHCLSLLLDRFAEDTLKGHFLVAGQLGEDGWKCKKELFVQSNTSEGVVKIEGLLRALQETDFFRDEGDNFWYWNENFRQ